MRRCQQKAHHTPQGAAVRVYADLTAACRWVFRRRAQKTERYSQVTGAGSSRYSVGSPSAKKSQKSPAALFQAYIGALSLL